MTTVLVAMDSAAFENYLQIAIPAYAQTNIESGRWEASTALEQSRQAHSALLPQGAETENHYLFNIRTENSDENVGHIWVHIDDQHSLRTAFIYDIEIYESFRRKGYARSALKNIEEFVAGLGARSLGLHVFNHNQSARALYESMGFVTVSHNMKKTI
ncbi:GNAT family N-acetyltransferase [Spongorhabdus nitratireducens]